MRGVIARLVRLHVRLIPARLASRSAPPDLRAGAGRVAALGRQSRPQIKTSSDEMDALSKIIGNARRFLARALALKGADLIAHPANLVLPYCPDAMVTRCLENRVWAVTANRIGTEARGGKTPLRFIGQSEVVSPRGEILYRASFDQEELRVVEIDPSAARDKCLNPYNDLFAQRRPELYG